MKLIFLALICFPVCLFANEGLPSQPYIFSEGKAEIEKAPDFVTLSFRVVARNADRAKANQEVQAKASRVFSLLNEANIAQKDVIAEDLSSEPDYQQDEKLRNKLIGYIVTRPVEVKVRDIPSFPKLVDNLIVLGGIEFAHIEPGLSTANEIEEDLSQKALVDARERAEKSVKALGLKIDSIFAVSSVQFSEIRNKLFETERDHVIVTGSNVPAGKERVEPSEYRLGPYVVSRHVYVIYLVSPAK